MKKGQSQQLIVIVVTKGDDNYFLKDINEDTEVIELTSNDFDALQFLVEDSYNKFIDERGRYLEGVIWRKEFMRKIWKSD